MLAPIDKFRSRVNDIIQIIVTTACTLQCSNCTQLLPFRKDYRHMSLECFREAVQSLKDWPGVIGIFGGNPCNHPKFPELCKILQEEIPDQKHRGLWSNDLLNHGEIARETFWPDGRFNLNAHAVGAAAVKIERFLPGKIISQSAYKPAIHSPILINRADVKVNNADWINARETCDINRKWSGAIAERDGKPFAYFCEVAAAIDGIRGTNNGIPAIPGWWAFEMPLFQDQVRTCCDSGCGVPLRAKGQQDNAETYDVSASWISATENPRGHITVNPVESVKETVRETTDYMKAR
jgi:hypothetical protein